MGRGRRKILEDKDIKSEIMAFRLTKQQRMFLDNNPKIKKMIVNKIRKDIDKIQQIVVNN